MKFEVAGIPVELFGGEDISLRENGRSLDQEEIGSDAAIVLMHAFGEEGEKVWEELQKQGAPTCCLAVLSLEKWEDTLSPWVVKRVFKGGEEFGSGADAHLELLEREILPEIRKRTGIAEGPVFLAGYSFAGLFALYSLYKTNIFAGAVSASGSLWFPNFLEYATKQGLKAKPKCVYLSLGDAESRSRNEILRKVGENTQEIYEHYRDLGIECIYESNPGNHFQEADKRLAKGIAWILGKADMAKSDGSEAFKNVMAGFGADQRLSDENGEGVLAGKYVDLHLHLDGAVTLEIAKKLAKMQGIRLPAEKDDDLRRLLTVPEDCNSLNDFLKCFALPLSLMQTPQGLSEAVRLVGEHAFSQGVIYAEIRFAPQLHCERGMTQEEAVLATLEGLRQVETGGFVQGESSRKETKLPRNRIKANLILCCMRGEGNEVANEETLRLAKKYLVEDGGVVALDLAGAEALFPTADYRELFAKAKAEGIPFTIHAGEADGPESVRLAVEYGARRIGHGVRSFEDPETVRLIREKGIPLEMCPTSNRQTHAVEDMSSYPLTDYLDQGIKVTVNTDDPGIEGTTLAKEFRYLEDCFGLTRQQKQILLHNAIQAAFTTEAVKSELMSIVSLADGKGHANR